MKTTTQRSLLKSSCGAALLGMALLLPNAGYAQVQLPSVPSVPAQAPAQVPAPTQNAPAPAAAAHSADGMVVVRMYETGTNESQIIVSYGGGRRQVIPLGNPNNYKNFLPNADKLQMVTDRLAREGYVLAGSMSGGHNDLIISTLIFKPNTPQ